jgi:succinylglutamate desuccinylase
MWREEKRKVAIVGGTHGNERNGVYLVKHIESELSERNYNFQHSCILANPRAIEENRRYFDTDLNRCFLPQDLLNSQNAKEYERNRAYYVKFC